MRIRTEIVKPVRLRKLTELMKINGVSVYVHWSVLVIAALILLNAPRQLVLTLVCVTAWLAVMLIHECGHMIAAHRRNCDVFAIELYPIFGITRFEVPWSHFDHCVIAWGGVLAQAIVAIPFVAWIVIVGYTSFDPVNAVVALLGGYNLIVAVLNLLPIGSLDGAIAWQIIPEFIRRQRQRRNRTLPRYRSPR